MSARGAGIVLVQILDAAVMISVISGLIGVLVVHFVGAGGVLNGSGWGMVIAGGLVGWLAGGSGSPSENLVRGRSGAFRTYWGTSSPLPQSPIQLALGGCLAFVAGVGLLILSYR